MTITMLEWKGVVNPRAIRLTSTGIHGDLTRKGATVIVTSRAIRRKIRPRLGTSPLVLDMRQCLDTPFSPTRVLPSPPQRPPQDASSPPLPPARATMIKRYKWIIKRIGQARGALAYHPSTRPDLEERVVEHAVVGLLEEILGVLLWFQGRVPRVLHAQAHAPQRRIEPAGPRGSKMIRPLCSEH
jgi:hypothetical protein